MHPVILILLALAVWVMGYRFYGKFIKLGILQLHDDYAPPAISRSDEPDSDTRDPWTLSAFHAAAATGVLSIIGAAIAVVWGWVPAFLWVVVGSVVAATVLSLGTLWSTLRRSGDSLAGLAFDLGGIPAALSLFFLGVILLVLVGGVLGMVLGSLLHAHPETTWPFLALLLIGRLFPGGGRRALLLAGAAVGALAAALAIGQYLPLSLGGSWTFSIRGIEVIDLRPELIWAVIALYAAYRAAGMRLGEGTHGRGILASLLTVLVLVLFVAGIAVEGNAIDAPQFHNVEGLPPAPVLIFLVVTGGALSGMHALVASGATTRGLKSQRDVIPVSYLGVGLDSLVAVMVIVALVTGFADRAAWDAMYDTWPVYGGLYVWVDQALTRVAFTIGALGIPVAWSIGLVAAMATALALSMLETVLRLLSASVDEFVQDFEFEWVNTPTFKQRCAVVMIGIATLLLAQAQVNLQHWLLVGIVNQWFACAVLALLGLFLLRARRPALLCWAPLVVIAPLSVWGTAWIGLQWYRQGDWVLLAVGTLACLTAAVYFAACTGTALRLRRQVAPDDQAPSRF